MKIIRRIAAIAAAGVAVQVVVLALAAAGASAAPVHSGNAVAQGAAAKTYALTFKFGKVKAPAAGADAAGADVAQVIPACAPPLITFSRTVECLFAPATVVFEEKEDDKVVAAETYDFDVQVQVLLSASSTQMTVNGSIIPISIAGDLPEPVPTATLGASCAPCTVVSPLFALGTTEGAEGSGKYNVTTSANKTVVPALTIGAFAEAGDAKSSTASYGVPGVRCDDMFPTSWKPGCVIPAFTPTVDMTGLPNIDKNILTVQNRGLHVGRPGAGTPLHRGTNAQVIKNNRNQVCPKSLKRPAGYQCDEYPFASTAEGGTTLAAVNRNVAFVPAAENSSQGTRLSAFYRANRVLDGDALYVQA